MLHPPVQAEDQPWTSKVDRPGKRAADVQSEDLEDNEQMDANESAASLPQAESKSSDGRMIIGNWEHDESETHNQHLKDKVVGDEYHSRQNDHRNAWCRCNCFFELIKSVIFVIRCGSNFSN